MTRLGCRTRCVDGTRGASGSVSKAALDWMKHRRHLPSLPALPPLPSSDARQLWHPWWPLPFAAVVLLLRCDCRHGRAPQPLVSRLQPLSGAPWPPRPGLLCRTTDQRQRLRRSSPPCPSTPSKSCTIDPPRIFFARADQERKPACATLPSTLGACGLHKADSGGVAHLLAIRPQHPAAHGVLRLILELNGEEILRTDVSAAGRHSQGAGPAYTA